MHSNWNAFVCCTSFLFYRLKYVEHIHIKANKAFHSFYFILKYINHWSYSIKLKFCTQTIRQHIAKQSVLHMYQIPTVAYLYAAKKKRPAASSKPICASSYNLPRLLNVYPVHPPHVKILVSWLAAASQWSGCNESTYMKSMHEAQMVDVVQSTPYQQVCLVWMNKLNWW